MSSLEGPFRGAFGNDSEKYMDTHTNTFDSYFVYMNMKMAVAQHMKLE